MDNIKLQEITRDVNIKYSEYDSMYEKEYKQFKNNLLEELEYLFNYYKINMNIDNIENMIDQFKSMIFNACAYKKIMNENLDFLNIILSSPNMSTDQNIDYSLQLQRKTQRSVSFDNCIYEMKHEFNKVLSRIMNDPTEVSFYLKKHLDKLKENVQELNSKLINENENALETLRMINAVLDDNALLQIDNVLNTLPTQEAISFVDKKLAEFDTEAKNKVVDEILNKISIKNKELKEYLESINEKNVKISSNKAAFK